MSAYHMAPGERPDRHKIAGFLARWIAKERPIQLRKELSLKGTLKNTVFANSGLE